MDHCELCGKAYYMAGSCPDLLCGRVTALEQQVGNKASPKRDDEGTEDRGFWVEGVCTKCTANVKIHSSNQTKGNAVNQVGSDGWMCSGCVEKEFISKTNKSEEFVDLECQSCGIWAFSLPAGSKLAKRLKRD